MERVKNEREMFRNEVKGLLRQIHPDAFRFDLLADSEKQVERIRRESEEMSKILNALLEQSKIDVPKYLPEPFRSRGHINFWHGTFLPYKPVKEFLSELQSHITYRKEFDARKAARENEPE